MLRIAQECPNYAAWGVEYSVACEIAQQPTVEEVAEKIDWLDLIPDHVDPTDDWEPIVVESFVLGIDERII